MAIPTATDELCTHVSLKNHVQLDMKGGGEVGYTRGMKGEESGLYAKNVHVIMVQKLPNGT